MTFVQVVKSIFTCPCSLLASPAHPLNCWGISLRQLFEDQDLFTCRNCGGGDRGRVAIYRPFGEFRRAKIVLSPVWCSRPTTGVPLAHATMNFVGLDLTTSDSQIMAPAAWWLWFRARGQRVMSSSPVPLKTSHVDEASAHDICQG
ncbi:hypothetical protein TNCV_3749101 [Trichonephila clavipes]|nr:hypothetical protein TNCV_3749101 [Trichonephila clavipes]